jgi:hypothetical protein
MLTKRRAPFQSSTESRRGKKSRQKVPYSSRIPPPTFPETPKNGKIALLRRREKFLNLRNLRESRQNPNAHAQSTQHTKNRSNQARPKGRAPSPLLGKNAPQNRGVFQEIVASPFRNPKNPAKSMMVCFGRIQKEAKNESPCH